MFPDGITNLVPLALSFSPFSSLWGDIPPPTVQLDQATVYGTTNGSVTSFLAGRTYPLEGTAVLFPQHAPYTDPLTVLICGGSNFGIALDNCVNIQPEVENPQWVLERMVRSLWPRRRPFFYTSSYSLPSAS